MRVLDSNSQVPPGKREEETGEDIFVHGESERLVGAVGQAAVGALFARLLFCIGEHHLLHRRRVGRLRRCHRERERLA